MPFTFYYIQDNDWSSSHNYDYWNINFTSAVSLNNTITLKTINDPSVSGFALPRTAAFSNSTSTGNDANKYGQFNVSGSFAKGWYFYTTGWRTGSTVFLHALGFRDVYSGRSTGTGDVAYVFEDGYYWLSGASSASGARFLGFDVNNVCPNSWRDRACGSVVLPALE